MKYALLATASVMAFMSETAETVIVKLDGNEVRVNKADFEADQADGGEKRFTLAKAATKEADKEPEPAQTGFDTNVHPELIVPVAPSAPDFVNGGKPVPPTIPSPNQYGVIKDGRKWFVARNDGSKVEDIDGIDKAGYAAEQAAWDAIIALPH